MAKSPLGSDYDRMRARRNRRMKRIGTKTPDSGSKSPIRSHVSPLADATGEINSKFGGFRINISIVVYVALLIVALRVIFLVFSAFDS